MRHVKGNCPLGPRTAAWILNKVVCENGVSPAARRRRGRELPRLISLSCHGAWRPLSITEWVHHTNGRASTTAARQTGQRDGWVTPSDTVQLAEARDQSLSRWTKLPPPPLLRMALHQENEICLHCLPQKINFIRPSTDR